jgi:hypothetical protein
VTFTDLLTTDAFVLIGAIKANLEMAADGELTDAAALARITELVTAYWQHHHLKTAHQPPPSVEGV